jgi:hypothetical protein
MSLLKKILAGTALLGLVVLVVSYFYLGSIIKKGIETVGPKVTRTTISVGAVTLSPFSGKGRIRGLKVGNPTGFKSENALQMKDFKIHIAPGSLSTNVIHVRSILIDGPEITKEGANLDTLQRNVQSFVPQDSAPTEKKSPPKKVIIDDLWIRDAKVHVEMLGKMMTVPIADIRLKDLGKDSGGISPAQATSRALGSVLSGVASGMAGVGRSVTNEVGKLGGGLKGLFQKK